MFEKSLVAVDIGSYSTKIMFGNRKKISMAVAILTPQNSFEDNRILDTKVMANYLQYVMKEKLVRAKDISFVIHGQDIIFRVVEVPVMDVNNLNEAVSYEVKQNLPDGGENFYIDYQIIKKEVSKEKKVYRLLAAAAPMDMIDAYVEVAEALNMNLASIDVFSNCCSRVFKNVLSKKGENKLSGIINLGAKNTIITILENGVFAVERELAFGMDNILREIMRRLNVDYNEARSYLSKDFSLESNRNDEIDKRIMSLFENIFISANKVIHFYCSGKSKKSLDDLFIIGGGAGAKGIDSYLSRYLDTKVYKSISREGIGLKVALSPKVNIGMFASTLGLIMRRE